MKFNLLEKIMISNILPAEGNIKTLMIIKDIKKKVELTQDDYKEYDINVMPNGTIRWSEKGSLAEFEIEFTELETIEIKLALQKLDKEKKLSIDHLSLVNLFGILGE